MSTIIIIIRWKPISTIFFSYAFTNSKSLVRLFKADICWFLKISCFEKKTPPPWKTLDKKDTNNSVSIGSDLDDWPSPSWLLTVDKIPTSLLCYHNALIWYDFKSSFFNSQADFLYLFLDDLDPLL